MRSFVPGLVCLLTAAAVPAQAEPLEPLVLPCTFLGAVGPQRVVPTSVPARLPESIPCTPHPELTQIPLSRIPALIRPPTPLPGSLPYVPPPSEDPNKPWLGTQPGSSPYDPKLLYLPDSIPDRPHAKEPCRCEKHGRFWLQGAYFYGTTREDSIPPLIQALTPMPLGLQFATFPDDTLTERNFRSGLNLRGGFWLNHCETLAAEGGLFTLESDQEITSLTSLGIPILNRQLFDPNLASIVQSPIAFPGTRIGTAGIRANMALIAAEANLRSKLWCSKATRIDAIAGYRFFRLGEDVSIDSTTINQIAVAGFPGGTQSRFLDAFDTENRFHGGQIGLAGEYRWHHLFLHLTGKVAFGVNFQETQIEAGTQVILPNGFVSQGGNGGLVAAPLRGNYRSNEFTVLPEIGVRLGYELNEHWRAYLGYHFLYLNNVARPGEVIQATLNPAVIADSLDPGFSVPDAFGPSTGFWIQGITLGLEWRF